MSASSSQRIAVTGLGVVTAIGQGKPAFIEALLGGRSAFSVMQRAGRQCESAFIGAELSDLEVPAELTRQTLRAASLSATAALTVVDEAWREARLGDVEPNRVGLVVGGSNLQQREQSLMHEAYRERSAFLRPVFGMSFMDTDLCGFCTQQFGIRGMAHTVGGASASGQMAIIQAADAVRAGRVEACVAVGGLMDLSHWECRALRSLGAMGSDRHADRPESACRPFDAQRDGFIYGEGSAALVLETEASARRRGVQPYAWLSGSGIAMDANRNPDPSLDGEMRAIGTALRCAELRPEDIDYVNPHGTGSRIGDETELAALRHSGLAHAHLNATKSLTGHGLTAAGAVEAVATLLQMRAQRLHATRNLVDPIDAQMRWVDDPERRIPVRHALTLSMGFGGINTALCWTHGD